MWFCPIDGTLLLVGENRGGPFHNNNYNSSSANNNAIEDYDDAGNCFYCSTCPYMCPVAVAATGGGAANRSSSSARAPAAVVIRTSFVEHRKQVDDILGGAAAWANVDRTMTVCPACNHNEAYFLQMQIRSADEPMSIFYKCTQCNNQWNDK